MREIPAEVCADALASHRRQRFNLLSGYRGLLLIVAAVAVLLGFYGTTAALHSDEAWTLRAVTLPWPAMMDELEADIHPPLYYLLLRGWVAMLGNADVAVRALSVLCYLATAAVLFWGGRGVWGVRTGLLAAVIYLVSPLAIYAAHFARMYALMGLISALSVVSFCKIVVRGDRSKAPLLTLGLATAAGSFVHVWFFFLVAAQGVAAMRKAFRVCVVLGLSLVPYAIVWLPVLLRQMETWRGAVCYLPPPTVGAAASVLFLHAGVFLPFVGFVALRLRRRPGRPNGGVPMLLALWAVCLATPLLLSYSRPVFHTKYTIVALPCLALACGAAAAHLSRGQLEKVTLGFGALLAMVLIGPRTQTCDSRWTASYLASNARASDVVIFTNISRMAVDRYWHDLQPRGRAAERSYPADIDEHLGYDTVLRGRAGRSRMEQEALAIAREASARGGRVFVLHAGREAPDGILTAALDRTSRRATVLCVECPGEINFHSKITAWEPLADERHSAE